MDDMPRTLKPWVTFAGCVLVVVVLYWAQAVLVAIALAILLTFVLTPPVTSLQRWIGRIPAVLAIVTLVFTVLGLAGWGLARQMDHLAEDLPRYRVNHPGEDRGRTRRGQGRIGREAAGDNRRHQDRPWCSQEHRYSSTFAACCIG
jgi:predicted PurR-regulated permease PerM